MCSVFWFCFLSFSCSKINTKQKLKSYTVEWGGTNNIICVFVSHSHSNLLEHSVIIMRYFILFLPISESIWISFFILAFQSRAYDLYISCVCAACVCIFRILILIQSFFAHSYSYFKCRDTHTRSLRLCWEKKIKLVLESFFFALFSY